ncbi:hypothetical protein BGW39_000989 [Mortierella sp. 14UC]|nr:hypothetical protein BGW39_000989 [Mortierella sp. 14UC]
MDDTYTELETPGLTPAVIDTALSLTPTTITTTTTDPEIDDFTQITIKATIGDKDAQGDIYKDGKNNADLYHEGQGVTQDYARALEWYLKAADQNQAAAEYNIRVVYEKGLGVEVDHVLAMEWYKKAAGRGDADAQFSIGWLYDNGEGGVPQDGALAMEWYLKAAEQGYNAAQFNLGLLYEAGPGLDWNYHLALKWFLKSALYHYGHEDLQQDYTLIVKWYLKSAAQDYSPALFGIGTL